MSQSKPLKSPFVITFASAIASLAAACGGSTTDDPSGSSGASAGGAGNATATGGGGNTSGGSGGAPSVCPGSFPSHGATCSLPSSELCTYPQGPCCPDWAAQCVDGQWVAQSGSCNPPAPAPCPAEPPVAGTPCGSSDACANPYQYCTYDECKTGEPNLVAECQLGQWQLSGTPCALPACGSLSACECFDRPDCQPVTDSCVCPCDFQCPGKPPCDCYCGGGQYLGCASAADPE